MGEIPPAPTVVEHENESFHTMVNFYFPGEECFICNHYEWKIHTWMRQQPKQESTLSLFSEDETGNGGQTFEPVVAGHISVVTAIFGSKGDDDQTIGLVRSVTPIDKADGDDASYGHAKKTGWCVKRGECDAVKAKVKSRKYGPVVETVSRVHSKWKLGESGEGKVVTMRYDRSKRCVLFWDSATTDGVALTILENLPNEDLFPFIGVYGNSADATEVRFCGNVEEEEDEEEEKGPDNTGGDMFVGDDY